jgi:hypothetical protein
VTSHDSIVWIAYDLDSHRLTVSFASLRKMVFYHVSPDIAAMLADPASLDGAFEMHVSGKFDWTEIGALPPQELAFAKRLVR